MTQPPVIVDPRTKASLYPLALPCVIDTSALIYAHRNAYPPELFPSLWQDLSAAVVNGRVLICGKVYDECLAKTDALAEWIEPLKPFVVPHDAAVEHHMAGIIASYPRLVYKGKIVPRSLADAALIATAITRTASVITKEDWKDTPKEIGIPNVCEHYRVPWGRFIELPKLLALSY